MPKLWSILVGPAGLARASRLVVTRLGLGTASRFRPVSEHRSGVLAPTQVKQLACFVPTIKTAYAVFIGRDGKTALELTFGIILTLDVYAKASERMRELIAWTPVVQPLAIAL